MKFRSFFCCLGSSFPLRGSDAPRIVHLFLGGIRHHDKELISALAEYHVAAAEYSLQNLSELGQDRIALKRSVLIIDGAKIIDVDGHKAQVAAQAVGPGYFPRDQFVHGAAVEKLGERVD